MKLNISIDLEEAYSWAENSAGEIIRDEIKAAIRREAKKACQHMIDESAGELREAVRSATKKAVKHATNLYVDKES